MTIRFAVSETVRSFKYFKKLKNDANVFKSAITIYTRERHFPDRVQEKSFRHKATKAHLMYGRRGWKIDELGGKQHEGLPPPNMSSLSKPSASHMKLTMMVASDKINVAQLYGLRLIYYPDLTTHTSQPRRSLDRKGAGSQW